MLVQGVDRIEVPVFVGPVLADFRVNAFPMHLLTVRTSNFASPRGFGRGVVSDLDIPVLDALDQSVEGALVLSWHVGIESEPSGCSSGFARRRKSGWRGEGERRREGADLN